MSQRDDGNPDQTINAPRDQVPLSGLEVVDLNDPENVKYWCERWQVTPGQLREAVERGGGTDSPTVSLALGLEAP